MSLNLEQGSGLTFAQALTAAGHVTGLTGAAATHSTPLLGYAIDGDSYTKAAAAGASTANAVTAGQVSAITITANNARAIVWAVKADGTTGVFAGPVVPSGDAGGNLIKGAVLPLPAIPAGWAPIAVHTYQGNGSLSGTHTFGTSNWNVSGLVLEDGKGTALPGGAARSVSQLPNVPLRTA